jgi:hypothetical protein
VSIAKRASLYRAMKRTEFPARELCYVRPRTYMVRDVVARQLGHKANEIRDVKLKGRGGVAVAASV